MPTEKAASLILLRGAPERKLGGSTCLEYKRDGLPDSVRKCPLLTGLESNACQASRGQVDPESYSSTKPQGVPRTLTATEGGMD